MWAESFKPRLAVEAVRNCTHVEYEVKDLIVSAITTALLKEENFIRIEVDDDTAVDGGQGESSSRHWNKGGSFTYTHIIHTHTHTHTTIHK